jgi:hypothetical protein
MTSMALLSLKYSRKKSLNSPEHKVLYLNLKVIILQFQLVIIIIYM